MNDVYNYVFIVIVIAIVLGVEFSFLVEQFLRWFLKNIKNVKKFSEICEKYAFNHLSVPSVYLAGY